MFVSDYVSIARLEVEQLPSAVPVTLCTLNGFT